MLVAVFTTVHIYPPGQPTGWSVGVHVYPAGHTTGVHTYPVGHTTGDVCAFAVVGDENVHIANNATIGKMSATLVFFIFYFR